MGALKVFPGCELPEEAHLWSGWTAFSPFF